MLAQMRQMFLGERLQLDVGALACLLLEQRNGFLVVLNDLLLKSLIELTVL